MQLEHEKCLEIICFLNAHIEPILIRMLVHLNLHIALEQNMFVLEIGLPCPDVSDVP